MRLEITTPATTGPVSFVISPDGGKLVFVAASDGQDRLWLRSFGSATARVIADTEGATLPFWSPDSRSVGFFAGSQLKRVDIGGGTPSVLASAIFGFGGSWGRGGTDLFAPTAIDAIFRVPATGGQPAAVTHVDRPRQAAHYLPQWLPDGRHFLFYADAADGRGVYVASLDGSNVRRLLDTDSAAVVASPHHLLFSRQNVLFGQPFDVDRPALLDEPFVVADSVGTDGAYLAATAATSTHRQIGRAHV